MTDTLYPALPGAVGDPSGDVSPWWLVAAMLRDRRQIYAWTAIAFCLALAVALWRKPTYTTTFSFQPQSGQDPSKAGLAGLAGQFGVNLGTLSAGGQSPQLYADLLTMREVLAPIATDTVRPDSTESRTVPLATFLDVSGKTPPLLLENTMRELRREVISSTVAARTTGMVTVNVRTSSPLVSLHIAQRLLERLNYFNLVTRQSQAREERRFTEARLAEAQAALRKAEDAMQAFLQTNRRTDNSPALRFDAGRLEREVSLQQQLVASLAQQFEENRIREVRDTPVITVFERPVPAARRDPGMRALILLFGTLAGALLGAVFVLIRDTWQRRQSRGRDPALSLLSTEWQRFRGRKSA